MMRGSLRIASYHLLRTFQRRPDACVANAPTARAMPKLGKQGCKHFQSPRINTTVTRKERTIAPPDFMKNAGAISAFYRIFGQGFEIETADFWENEKDFGKTAVDSWGHEPRRSF